MLLIARRARSLAVAASLTASALLQALPAFADAPSSSSPAALGASPTPVSGQIVVDARAASLANTIIPIQTIGAGVDAVAAGHVKGIYSPSNVRQILTAGDGPISYRLYTELSVQQWHWNPQGAWSDSATRSGYFTGSADSKDAVLDTYGYNLPHRGGTHDQGNNEGYSRIDDGDPKTYWKSNPYLTSAYTREADSLHPQWILVDLGSAQPVSAVQINWSNPYATRFKVQYWTGRSPIDNPAPVHWFDFPTGTVTAGQGGLMTIALAPQPISARYVRVVMTESSGTQGDESANDPRSRMGYAVSELGVGTMDASGAFHDLVTHEPDDKQSEIFCSSTDSWHTDADQEKLEEQPGFDTVYRSGLTRGLPIMVPVGIVYNTPEDAVAELEFLQRRGYKVSYVESGEEADEQWMYPEDFASLYCQWATAIHARFPDVKFGGPVMSGQAGTAAWPDANGQTDWIGRFYAYLQSHGHAKDLAFYSFEFYPDAFQGFRGRGLLEVPDVVDGIFAQKRLSRLPDSTPAFLTEYNLGGYSPEQPDLYGAVWHADFLASFLTKGGRGIYYYEYEPLPFGGHGQDFGSFSMFSSGDDNKIRQPLSQYFSTRLTNLYWLDPKHSNLPHQLYPASGNFPLVFGHVPVTAYAVHRPDGLWSVLLVNKNYQGDCSVTVAFNGDNGVTRAFTGPVTQTLFSPKQYAFQQNGENGTAQPDGPEASSTISAAATSTYTLPAQSITVLTGSIQ